MSFDLLDAKDNLYNLRTISGLIPDGTMNGWIEMFREPFLDKLESLGFNTSAELAGVLDRMIDYEDAGEFLLWPESNQDCEMSAFGLILFDRLVRLRNSNAPVDDCLNKLFQLFECYGYVLRDDRKSLKFFRTEFARAGALGMLAKDPKQKEKALVRECWELWQSEPKRYTGKAAFALDMLGKFESLKSQAVIERWCREWEKESGTQPA